MIRNYMANLQSELDLEKIVVEKVSGFSSDKLEAYFEPDNEPKNSSLLRLLEQF